MLKKLLDQIKQRPFDYLAYALIAAGIFLRILLLLQNRNLIIDEANVVRNIHARSFIQLLQPLDYDQFAPPLYLWALKICGILFGYGEISMRLVALIFGVISLFLFKKILLRFFDPAVAWLPLGLLCVAPIYVKYATEVKQYIPDLCIALLLIYQTLKYPITQTTTKHFTFRWIIIGSLAIWSSQPSVFILATIGLYYFFTLVKEKKIPPHITPLILLSAVWLIQFCIYYFTILQSQIGIGWLKIYHSPYFIISLPENAVEWRHNWTIIRRMLNNTVGYYMPPYILGSVVVFIGFWSLLKNNFRFWILVCTPLLLAFIASALQQFSLIERVALFLLPFLLILLGAGYEVLWKSTQNPVRILALAIAILILGFHNFGSLLYRKYQFQEITLGFDWLLEKQALGATVYIDKSSKDTYVYYTQIHPNKGKYTSLLGAYTFSWDDNNTDFKNVIASSPHETIYILFTGGGDTQRQEWLSETSPFYQEITSYTPKNIYTYVYCLQKKH